MRMRLLERAQLGEKFYLAWSFEVNKGHQILKWDDLPKDEQEKWEEAAFMFVREFGIALQISYPARSDQAVHEPLDPRHVAAHHTL